MQGMTAIPSERDRDIQRDKETQTEIVLLKDKSLVVLAVL